MNVKERKHYRRNQRKPVPQRKRLTRREKIQKQARRQRRLATIRRVPDDLWELIRPLLPPEKPAGTVGRPIVPYRTVLDGILYVLRTGCQWKMASVCLAHRLSMEDGAEGIWVGQHVPQAFSRMGGEWRVSEHLAIAVAPL